MPLTDIACRNAKATNKQIKLSDAHGLFLLIKPNGGKYWRMKYRYLGKEKALAIGVYPEVSLLEAREARDKARKLLRDDIDPSETKKEKKRALALNAENTFEALAREWHGHVKGKWTERHAAYNLNRLEKDIFPEIGKTPIRNITPLLLLSALKKIEQRGAQEIAHRVKQMCSQVFRYAIVTGRADRDVARDLDGALKPVKAGHFAAFDYKELPNFVMALERNEARLYPLTRAALRLMLLTFVRTGELIEAMWSEIEWDECRWVIPAKRMKMRREHIVPLSKQAVDLLREIYQLTNYSDYIFPHQSNPRKFMSNGTILGALKRMGYKGQMTGHGFRALAMSTIKERLGYRHEVIDRQLAHAPANKIVAAYDRAAFLKERTKMMQKWADYIDNSKS